MKYLKKNFKTILSIIVVLLVLILLGSSSKVNLKRRAVYAGCDSGCNTDVSDVNDCIGFLSYLKSNAPGFVSAAKKMNVNIDKPDEYKKTVSSDGSIRCYYYSD